MEALELPKVDIITYELATMCRKLEIAGVPTASVALDQGHDHAGHITCQTTSHSHAQDTDTSE
jgi:hypothetical protein